MTYEEQLPAILSGQLRAAGEQLTRERVMPCSGQAKEVVGDIKDLFVHVEQDREEPPEA